MYSLQNPNALDSKVLLDFDHVKNNLNVDDEGMLHAAPSFVRYNFFYGDVATAFVLVCIGYDIFGLFCQN